MKKFLLIFGIIIIIVGVLALAFVILNCYMHQNVLDGSVSLYEKIQTQMKISAIIGIVTFTVGVVSMTISAKLQS